MRYRHILAILVVTLCCLNGWSQLDIGKQGEQPRTPSWEVFDMIQYGKIGATAYTGTVNYSIPIYTYKDKDFEIPVSIDYATNGFRTNHISGLLGHGWSLSVPGIITRRICGIPDDKFKGISLFASIYSIFCGGYAHLPSGGNPGTLQYVMSSDGQYILTLSDGYAYYETERDMYTFNFCGHKGCFMLNPNNETVGGQKFRVFDATGATCALQIASASDGSFVITDTDGFKYDFVDGEFYDQNPAEHLEQDYVTTTWILRTITAPNGRNVSFGYTRSQNLGDLAYDETYHSYMPKLTYYQSVWNYENLPYANSEAEVSDMKSSGYRLDNIFFGDSVRIHFEYTDGVHEHRKLGGGGTTAANERATRLSDVTVFSGGTVIKRCRLGYVTNIPEAHPSASNCITFLKTVDITGEGLYTFDYNNENGNYPFLGSSCFDHWGYFNGMNAGFKLSTHNDYLSYDDYHNEHIIGTAKDPDFSSSVMGTLSRICYPTGGHSTLEYEPHSYSQAMVRTFLTGFLPELRDAEQNFQAGGVRIKRIITQLSEGSPCDTLSFEYHRSDDPELSSGILTSIPRYGIEYDAAGALTQGIKHVSYYNMCNSMFDYNSTGLEYSDVTVHRSGEGWTLNKYTSSVECPDQLYSLPIDSIILWTPLNSGYIDYFRTDNLVRNILTPVPSRQNLRGRLKEELQYDKDGALSRRTWYGYSEELVGVDNVLCDVGEIVRSVKFPRFNSQLSSKCTTDYSQGTAISKTELYEYNRYGLPTSIKTSTSQGDTIVTRNTYVADTVVANTSLNDPVINGMASNHMLGKLLASETHRIVGGTDNLLSATRLTYSKPDANKCLACPSMKEEWIPGEGWKTVERYQFDTMGNLVEVTDEGNLTSSYLWSYDNCHLVSTLRNATMAQTATAMAAVGLGTQEQLAAVGDVSAEDYGRLGQLGGLLPASLQESWRYRPLVGMTESTPPNHASGFYRYDGYGRLAEISDSEGKVVGQQKYNIVTVLPMTSVMLCDSVVSVEDTIHASTAASGGSGIYDFRWSISDTSGAVVLSLGEGASISICPQAAGLCRGSHVLTCVATDRMTGETSATHHDVEILPMRIQFSNISTSVDMSGNKTISATITSDDSVNVTFNLSYVTTGQCALRIGDFTQYYTGHAEDVAIVRQLAQGANTVSITLTDSAIAQAQLTITQAGEHPVGNEKTLTIEF